MIPVINMEYVYTAEESGEYRTVRISMQVDEDSGAILLKPDHEMSIQELENVLRDFDDDVLKKMRFRMVAHCSVQIIYENRTYTVELDDAPRVKRLVRS